MFTIDSSTLPKGITIGDPGQATVVIKDNLTMVRQHSIGFRLYNFHIQFILLYESLIFNMSKLHTYVLWLLL